MTETISCACCTRTVISLLATVTPRCGTVITHCAYVVCYFRDVYPFTYFTIATCVHQSFSALTLLVGRQEGHPACKNEWWGAGTIICLERGADLHTAQLMPLPLTVSCFSKIQIGLPFWYRLTRVVPEKGPLNVCSCSSSSSTCVHHLGLYCILFRRFLISKLM